MTGTQRRRVLKALDVEINRAKLFHYYFGILILDVAETIPRGVHKHLPGVTVSVSHIQSLLRDCDAVTKTSLRRYAVILPHLEAGESADLLRDRIQFTARLHNWGTVNVGIAIFPEDGLVSRDLLRAAEKDLRESTEATNEEELLTA